MRTRELLFLRLPRRPGSEGCAPPGSRLRGDGLGAFGGALGWIPAEEREGSGVRQREKLGCGAGTRSQPPPQGSWSKNGLEPGLPQEKGWSLYVSASRMQAAGKGV